MFGRPVIFDWHKEYRNVRFVGKIIINASDVRGQVKEGMAWHYEQYANEQSSSDQRAYSAAEADARRAEVGL